MLIATVPFMYCDPPAKVVTIRKPVDATHAGAGSVSLASGATFELSKGDDDAFILRLRANDRVALCYAPPQRFADAGPTARMAIAGDVRTGDYIYTLAYPAKHVASSAHARVPAVLSPALATLDGVALPIFAPSIFAGIAIDKKLMIVATHASDRYRLSFDYAPDCNGANVCSAGSFSGYGPQAIRSGKVKTPDGDLTFPPSDASDHNSRPSLANGETAYYAEWHSGASDGGNSRLLWRHNGSIYEIESRISTEASLVATANSALRNGPITP